jgi:hypothetical protein
MQSITAKTALLCPVCGLTNPSGYLVCRRCGTSLLDRDITVQLRPEGPEVLVNPDDVLLPDSAPLILKLKNTTIALPIAELLVIGRDIASNNSYHIDLAEFNAREQGVSRQHIRLLRKSNHVYISDLHSTNGTFLNGNRLVPEAECLIGHGAQLELGFLKIEVLFDAIIP